ncbi:MAG TPA: hypothetical protein VMR97_08505, partial [Acidimicrobiales bacterium]|nr:hypothetical protein [Acidimicrobiales bacterium]
MKLAYRDHFLCRAVLRRAEFATSYLDMAHQPPGGAQAVRACGHRHRAVEVSEEPLSEAFRPVDLDTVNVGIHIGVGQKLWQEVRLGAAEEQPMSHSVTAPLMRDLAGAEDPLDEVGVLVGPFAVGLTELTDACWEQLDAVPMSQGLDLLVLRLLRAASGIKRYLYFVDSIPRRGGHSAEEQPVGHDGHLVCDAT